MERRAISVRGLVQGVGFRPYVHSLARRHQLSGFVANQTDGVRIEVEGDRRKLEGFLSDLRRFTPPEARIERMFWERTSVVGEAGFRIKESRQTRASPLFLADRATCTACEQELFDPADRRFHYPFLNCTHCGPRLTIVQGAPYDRERTTMAPFTMCDACRKEYEDPTDRRFRAQPIACPACGPKLMLMTPTGDVVETDEPLSDFVLAILAGGIGALKGLGGYHLVADASSEVAVARLRRRKEGYEKPFAVMVGDLEVARSLAVVGRLEARLLSSPRRPIVLLRDRSPFPVAHAVAPGNPAIGVMLSHTPLHLLLMDAVSGRPLVMTTGNLSDEPIVYRDAELEQLSSIADIVLAHDRPIHVRIDDSVTRVLLGSEMPIRRSRGYAPEPLMLAKPAAQKILAVGGHLDNTFALGMGRRAVLSHHIGDLDELRARSAFERDLALYEELFEFAPEVIAHDFNPDYASTRYAVARASREGLPVIAVQHHHAHLASVMADNELSGPVIGVMFDDSGLGTDGTIWGGEFLVGDETSVERAAHLRSVPLPGGDAAAREPWRMALSYLLDAGLDPGLIVRRVGETRCSGVMQAIEKRVNATLTSSAGRLFDAVAAILGLRDRVSYEAQAAMELEWLSPDQLWSGSSYPFDFDGTIDTRGVIRGVVDDLSRDVDRSEIASRFHATMIAIVVHISERLREETSWDRVALSGGVFQNALLTEGVSDALGERGFQVFRHRRVPPNDGGLSLGQLAVASAKLATR